MVAPTNVRFRHIVGEMTHVYAVRADGALMWQDFGSNPPPPRPFQAVNCSQIGAGWESFTHLVSGGDGVLYAVDGSGNLHWYQDILQNGTNAPDGTTGWAAGSGNQIGSGFERFVHLIGTGNGVLYAIDQSGALYWYQDIFQNGANAPNGTSGWAANSGKQIGTGWNQFTHVISGGEGILYAVNPTGELLWYQDVFQNGANAPNGTSGWAPNSGSQIGAGWQSFIDVFGCRNGVLFGIMVWEWGTQLQWFQDVFRNGANGAQGLSGWANGSGTNIGGGGQGDGDGGGWQIADIEGFCWPPGGSPGTTIEFYVSSNLAIPYTISFVRMTELSPGSNQYGQAVAAPSSAPTKSAGIFQAGIAASTSGPTTYDLAWTNGCAWQVSFEFVIPQDWTSGIYAARCVAANNAQYDIIFVVQPALSLGENGAPTGVLSQNRLLVLVNTNTWNAYNTWGGNSNYTTADAQFYYFSYFRPNLHLLNCPTDHSQGPYQTVPGNHLVRSEIWLLDWLTAQGYGYDTVTDLDFHQEEYSLTSYAAIILSTHPEYWSTVMQDRLQAYLANSGSCLLYLGGDGMFRMVTFESGSAPNSQMNTACLYGAETFRQATPNRSEGRIFGVEWGSANDFSCTYTVCAASHPIIVAAGLPAQGGEPIVFGGDGRNGPASGWEVDVTVPTAPSKPPDPTSPWPNTLVLASHTLTQQSSMVIRDTGAWGVVFSVGSITFVGSLVVDNSISSMVRYVLNSILDPPAGGMPALVKEWFPAGLVAALPPNTCPGPS
jgi:N,N-dimethylformamidase